MIKITLIFTLFFLIMFLFYNYNKKETHKKYQLIHYLNNYYYNKDQHNHKNCPRGCNNQKQCVYPQYCYNSNPKDPFCCVNDLQCQKC